MSIEKNVMMDLRFDSRLLMGSRESMSTDDDGILGRSSLVSEDEDDDDDYDDADSGAGSDDFDLLELGESGSEFCQVGDQTCCVPFELYDLPDLKGVLSLEVWNECLTEEERFSLTRYLPDMDQETFMHTVKELLEGANFHFGSPLAKLFDMLKGGLCEPRVALYRQGLNFFQRCQHYHFLRKYQDRMATNLLKTRDLWQGYKGKGIQEKLRVLNLMRSQERLMYEKVGDVETDSSEREGSGDYMLGKRSKGRDMVQKSSRDHGYALRGDKMVASEPLKFGKQNRKGLLKPTGLKLSSQKHLRADLNSSTYGSASVLMKHRSPTTYDPSSLTQWLKDHMAAGDDMEEAVALGGDQYASHNNAMDRNGSGRSWKKRKSIRTDEYHGEGYMDMPMSSKFDYQFDRDISVNRLSDIKVLTARPPNMRTSSGTHAGARYPDPAFENHLRFQEAHSGHQSLQNDRSHESKAGKAPHDVNFKSLRNFLQQKDDRAAQPEKRAKSREKDRGDRLVNGVQRSRNFLRDEETESESSDPYENEEYSNHLMMNESNSQNALWEYSRPFVSKAGYDQKKVKYAGKGHQIDCISAMKKGKRKQSDADMYGQEESSLFQSTTQQQLDQPVSLKKQSKKKTEAGKGSLDVEYSEPPSKMAAPVLEMKPQKKPFIPITPTVHTGFSFSVVHLLSAVRMALITPNSEDSLEGGKLLGKTDDAGGEVAQEQNEKQASVNTGSQPANVPSLTLQEIVDRVRSNPRDPCILETQEPLQELVRGVLKILSSKVAPLGAKSWKPLVQFERLTKSWCWVGPVKPSTLDHEICEEVASPEAWGVPHKLLVKLVDAFANWLKSGQETLQQLGSLPAPPMEMMLANLDEKERFRDLRAQKSLATINPSSEEVRAYFRKEEQLRYSVPDRAFSYTALDGKKSIVAPLRRGGGKPSAKARDHFMLKKDRPPHVTILCLVRDAAARLPGSIGTRADVCTLIRDSQYIVEETSDADVNQVVSGALDRLHYERDPCVQFDGGRKLWVYLHRDREEEDFDDEGTSSTKKWKKPKKDAMEQEEGTTPVAHHGSAEQTGVEMEAVNADQTGFEREAISAEQTGFEREAMNAEQTGFDLSADLNLEPPSTTDDNPMDIVYHDTTQQIGDTSKTTELSEQGALHQCHPTEWEVIGFNHMQENKLFSRENSTTEQFDGDPFGMRQA